MSYARWGSDSDVYVYAHVGGFIDCCGCARLDSIAETVEHMREHVARGDKVPEYLLDPATYDEHDFVAMCMTYMCREDEGHEGPHTPTDERGEAIRGNSEVLKFEALLRGRTSSDAGMSSTTYPEETP